MRHWHVTSVGKGMASCEKQRRLCEGRKEGEKVSGASRMEEGVSYHCVSQLKGEGKHARRACILFFLLVGEEVCVRERLG